MSREQSLLLQEVSLIEQALLGAQDWVEWSVSLGSPVGRLHLPLQSFLIGNGDVSHFAWDSGGKEGSCLLGSLRDSNKDEYPAESEGMKKG